jgi:hypothetical protein
LLRAAASNVQSFFSTYGGKDFNFAQTYTVQQLLDQQGGVNPNGALANAMGLNTPAFGAVAYAAPTDAGGGYPQNTWDLLARADWILSSKTQAYFRYAQYRLEQQGSGFTSPYSQYNVGETDKDYAAIGSLTHVFSTSLLSSTAVSFSRLNSVLNYDKALQNVATLLVVIRATIAGNYLQFP